jgi:toxin-antitoxin system PIN domain toxin
LTIPDLNLILYAHDARSPFHKESLAWWEGLLNGEELVGIPWVVALGFLRMTTSPRVFMEPLSVSEASHYVSEWFECPIVRTLQPGKQHAKLLASLLKQVGVGGKLVTDAHICALAIEYRAVVHTNDRDFDRFSGVRLHHPLDSRP